MDDPGTSIERLKRSPRLTDFPVKDLRRILLCLEKISLSSFQVKALCERGEREAAQKAMAEIIEFCTNVSLADSITWSDWDCYEDLIEYFQACNIQNGRRAEKLELPPKWLEVGIYLLIWHMQKVMLQHRYNQEIAELPEEFEDVKTFDEIELIDNYSEDRATIKLKGKSDVRVRCSKLFNWKKIAAKTEKIESKIEPKMNADDACDDSFDVLHGDDQKVDESASQSSMVLQDDPYAGHNEPSQIDAGELEGLERDFQDDFDEDMDDDEWAEKMALLAAARSDESEKEAFQEESVHEPPAVVPPPPKKPRRRATICKDEVFGSSPGPSRAAAVGVPSASEPKQGRGAKRGGGRGRDTLSGRGRGTLRAGGADDEQHDNEEKKKVAKKATAPETDEVAPPVGVAVKMEGHFHNCLG